MLKKTTLLEGEAFPKRALFFATFPFASVCDINSVPKGRFDRRSLHHFSKIWITTSLYAWVTQTKWPKEPKDEVKQAQRPETSSHIILIDIDEELHLMKVGRDAATSDFVQVFLGIPYASPPTGNYRLIKDEDDHCDVYDCHDNMMNNLSMLECSRMMKIT